MSVLSSCHDGVLTLNRPACRNALDTASYDTLTQALRASDMSVGAIILTGAGGHFTAGNDLRDFQADRGEGDSPDLRFLRALVNCDLPAIATVEGYAIGIGVTLLQHCDFVYAGQGATLRMPFLALGLCPEGASSQVLARIAGTRRAAEWLLLGETFGPEAARDAGLINHVTETGQALAAAQATAARLAAQPREALRKHSCAARNVRRCTPRWSARPNSSASGPPLHASLPPNHDAALRTPGRGARAATGYPLAHPGRKNP